MTCKLIWGKRNFEAKKHPRGSSERKELNRDNKTSEYLPSYKYFIQETDKEKGTEFSSSTVSLTEAQKQVQKIVDKRGCEVVRE